VQDRVRVGYSVHLRRHRGVKVVRPLATARTICQAGQFRRCRLPGVHDRFVPAAAPHRVMWAKGIKREEPRGRAADARTSSTRLDIGPSARARGEVQRVLKHRVQVGHWNGADIRNNLLFWADEGAKKCSEGSRRPSVVTGSKRADVLECTQLHRRRPHQIPRRVRQYSQTVATVSRTNQPA
jgi:hypothetical protein